MVEERGAGPRATIDSQGLGSAVGPTTGGQQGCYERLRGDGGPTRHVCLMGVSERDDDAVGEVSLSFGKVSSIERNAKNRGIRVVTYDAVADATAAQAGLAAGLAPRMGRTVAVHFCSLVPPKPREGLRCTSETAGVDVPGLTLIKGFVTEEEEGSLLKHFVQGDDVRWTGPLKRRVQHFGRVFDYHTRHVDFDAPAPPLPECLTDVVREMGDRGLKPSDPDQLTLNEYKPGQGISPHVDTHSAFEDGLASLSLGSGCVMDMRHPDGVRVKNLYLPRGSLLVMEGPARYEWSHGIASRKTDMVDGVLTRRATRISFTFRRVRDPAVACGCDFAKSCDRETPVATATFLKKG
ncbi:conserved unknown protein [Ectocarpus siliculosus]|uniref:Fe2OG dioxygenase domain-containing protein n=1 Tax=Ectocarpus siliculosus TaxID=2880 RepID=D8LH20_ECTSI|nr:conserved unknown protein [Ectocarpus siliculosus]|eukprot:CBN75873.1 conserved unknown protein [Ectocarpus siliculosus]